MIYDRTINNYYIAFNAGLKFDFSRSQMNDTNIKSKLKKQNETNKTRKTLFVEAKTLLRKFCSFACNFKQSMIYYRGTVQDS